MKHEIDITKFNIMAFASNVLSFQNGFVTVTDENLGNVYFWQKNRGAKICFR